MPANDGPARSPLASLDAFLELLPKEARAKVGALQANEKALAAWFADDPARFEAFRRDPVPTLDAAIGAIGWQGPKPNVDPVRLALLMPEPRLPPPPPAGRELLAAVWDFVAKDVKNWEAYQADGAAVVRAVAADGKFKPEDIRAVLRVMLIAAGASATAADLTLDLQAAMIDAEQTRATQPLRMPPAGLNSRTGLI